MANDDRELIEKWERKNFMLEVSEEVQDAIEELMALARQDEQNKIRMEIVCRCGTGYSYDDMERIEKEAFEKGKEEGRKEREKEMFNCEKPKHNSPRVVGCRYCHNERIAQLEAEKKEAFEKGREAGRKEGKDETTKQLCTEFDGVADRLKKRIAKLEAENKLLNEEAERLIHNANVSHNAVRYSVDEKSKLEAENQRLASLFSQSEIANKKLREALEKIETSDCTFGDCNCQQIAKKALEGDGE